MVVSFVALATLWQEPRLEEDSGFRPAPDWLSFTLVNPVTEVAAGLIGVGLLGGGGVSAAMLAAVFLSNLPESIAATTGLAAAGWAHRRIMGLWLLVTAVAGLASLAGWLGCNGVTF